MRNNFLVKFSTYLLVAIMFIGQFSILSSTLLIPKKADAQFAVVNVETWSVYETLKDIGLGALRTVALKASNMFLDKFVNKLQDKYKIRNYLYYDRLLSDYYLHRLIADKITDPDLKRVYDLMYRGYISGQPTGANTNDPNAPNPNKALIPLLKKAMADYYIDQGGIDPAKIYNPGSFASDREYFSAAQAYFANPPSFTEQNLRGEFGAFQSSATTAAQLEISVGNGLKAGRLIGGTCAAGSLEEGEEGPLPPAPTSAKDPATCAAAGGKWQESALDMARSFIDNPTALVDKYLSGSIISKIDSNFDPNNFWAMVGSALGSFLFKQLTLDKPGDILEEYPNNYKPETGATAVTTGIDLDGDDVFDAYDTDGMRVCVYGGIDDGASASPGPPCKGSVASLTPPPLCDLELQVNSQINNQVNNSVTTDPTTGAVTNSANGNATGNATGTVTTNCPEVPPDGETDQCDQADPFVDPTGRSDDDWRDILLSLIADNPFPTVSAAALAAFQGSLSPAEWQHDSAGNLRPRLYLPTGPQTIANNIFCRPYDVGNFGGNWDWIRRY